MRAHVLVFTLVLAGGGCSGNAGFDFIEAHGMLADGAAFNAHNLASTARVPSVLDPLGYVVAVGSPFNGPEDLRGFRIEWQDANISAGQTYASDPNGPVVFYVVRDAPDAGAVGQTASPVSGGAITFNSTAGGKTTGAFSGLVLTGDGGAALATVASGLFQATVP